MIKYREAMILCTVLFSIPYPFVSDYVFSLSTSTTVLKIRNKCPVSSSVRRTGSSSSGASISVSVAYFITYGCEESWL